MTLIVPLIAVTYKNLGVSGWVVALVLLGVLAWSIMRSKANVPEVKQNFRESQVAKYLVSSYLVFSVF